VLLITITAVLACTAVLIYGSRVARLGRADHERLGPAPGSVLLPGWLMEAFYCALHVPGRALTRLGIEPDTLTYSSLVFSLPSLPLIATGHLVLAAVLIFIGGLLDALDGMVARARGRACPAGAVLDSFVDRLADAAPFIGLALFYRHRVLTLAIPLAALLASSLVSYARAKADIYQLKLPNGLMRRHERLTYLLGSLLLAPVAQEAGGVPYPATLAGVAIIAVVSAMAAWILVARIRKALAAADAEARVEPIGKRQNPRPPLPPEPSRSAGGA
jgi:CDP-diacylglycerol--glycerol-3-phosphate 3-phosphatidyltransferase